MFAICIETSHEKGVGHLFRMLNFINYLKTQKENFIFIINDNEKTKNILLEQNINFEIVDLFEYNTNWESRIIRKHTIKYWINDRLTTNNQHAKNVLKYSKLITFDDLGSGAKLSDLNICGLFFNKTNLTGKKILKGTNYLILNNEINEYKKERKNIKNILITLGGSDTYGVTIKVLKLLKKYNVKATIHIGPLFEHLNELNKELIDGYEIKNNISSLIKEFNKYDLAITGGGITPFEANASGLPCLIIANELFEIPNGEFLERNNSSIFLGYHELIEESIFNHLHELDIKMMSKNGLETLNTRASEYIYKEILSL